MLDFNGEDLCVISGRPNATEPIIVDGKPSVFRYTWDYLRHMKRVEIRTELEVGWNAQKAARDAALSTGVAPEDAPREYTHAQKERYLKKKCTKAFAIMARDIIRDAGVVCRNGTTPTLIKYKAFLADGNKTKIKKNVFCTEGVGAFRNAASTEIHTPMEETDSYQYALDKFTPEEDIPFLQSGLEAFDARLGPGLRRAEDKARKTACDNGDIKWLV